MLDVKTVKKRREAARKTLRNLKGKKEERINISKKQLMGYCNETIMFCETLLVLLRKEISESLNPICFGEYEKGKNVCFQCCWRKPCLEKTNR